MNHPNREEWVPYFYGEATAEARRRLGEHLENCPECREEFARWKRSAGRLSAWKLPRVHHPVPTWVPALRWASAAVMILAIGFGLGRFWGAHGDYRSLRATLEPQLRNQLRLELAEMVRQEVTQSATATLDAAGEQAQKLLATYALLNEQRRAEENRLLRADVLAVKNQLDTVAVNTDSSFRQLVAFARPPASKQN